MVTVATPVRISTKTDKSKLPHGLQSHIEPTLDWPCCAGHSFDGNSILKSIIAFPVTFQRSDRTSTQPGTKGRICLFCH